MSYSAPNRGRFLSPFLLEEKPVDKDIKVLKKLLGNTEESAGRDFSRRCPVGELTQDSRQAMRGGGWIS
jgi:hypothetical protein